MGRRVILGRPWRLSRSPLSAGGPAPAFAQHNREVLQGILGYSDRRCADLERAGVIAARPTQVRPLVHMGMDERVREGKLAYHDPHYKQRLGIEDADLTGEAPTT